jgi:hypothetical protein
MLIVRTKNAITKRVKVEASEHVNHYLIQNLEHKDIIKTAAASETERRGEERRGGQEKYIYGHCFYIWSLCLYMLTVFR